MIFGYLLRLPQKSKYRFFNIDIDTVCAYHGVSNVSFSENSAYILNE